MVTTCEPSLEIVHGDEAMGHDEDAVVDSSTGEKGLEDVEDEKTLHHEVGVKKVIIGGPAGPSSVGPSSVGPSSVGPSTVGPSSDGPRSDGPHSVGPSSVGPSSVGPSRACQSSVGPTGVAQEVLAQVV